MPCQQPGDPGPAPLARRMAAANKRSATKDCESHGVRRTWRRRPIKRRWPYKSAGQRPSAVVVVVVFCWSSRRREREQRRRRNGRPVLIASRDRPCCSFCNQDELRRPGKRGEVEGVGSPFWGCCCDTSSLVTRSPFLLYLVQSALAPLSLWSSLKFDTRVRSHSLRMSSCIYFNKKAFGLAALILHVNCV